MHIWSNHNAFSHLLSEFLSHGGINHFANQKHKWHWGISPLGTKKQHMAPKALWSFISKVYNLYVNRYHWTDLHFSFILGSFSELISLQIMDNKSIPLSLYIWFSTWVQLSKTSASAEWFCCKVNYGGVLDDWRRTQPRACMVDLCKYKKHQKTSSL